MKANGKEKKITIDVQFEMGLQKKGKRIMHWKSNVLVGSIGCTLERIAKSVFFSGGRGEESVAIWQQIGLDSTSKTFCKLLSILNFLFYCIVTSP